MRNSVPACVLIFLAMAGILAMWPTPVQAGGSFTWTGAADGVNWTNPCNWVPKDGCSGDLKYPGEEGPDDTVTLERTDGGAPVYPTLVEPITIAELDMADGVNLRGYSRLTVTTRFGWTGGRIFAEVSLASTAITTISGQDGKELERNIDYGPGILSNHGTATWVPDGPITLHGEASIQNHGIFVLHAPVNLYGGTCCVTSNTFVNRGLLQVENLIPFSPPQLALFQGVGLVNYGTVSPGSADLLLDFGNHEFNGGSHFAGSGVTTLNGPSAVISGEVTLDPGATLQLTAQPGSSAGILAGTGGLTGSGALLWTGGEMRAGLIISDSAHLTIDGVGDKVLNVSYGGYLINRGDARWKGSGPVKFNGPFKFTNLGTFTAESDAAFEGMTCCVLPTAAFDNRGVFIKSGGSGATTLRGTSLVNSGTLDVRQGTLDLDFGVHRLQDGGRLRGAGRLRLIGDYTDLWQTTTLEAGATLELANHPSSASSYGTLSGAGSFAGAGTFLWSGGILGAALRIEPGAHLRLEGTGRKALSTGYGAGRLDNAGDGILAGSGPLEFSGSALFRNLGSFDVASAAPWSGSTGGMAFENAGAFSLSAPGVTSFSNLHFVNRGTATLGSGVLQFVTGGQYVQTGGATVLQGGAISTTLPVRLLWGELRGGGVITGSLENAGTVAPSVTVGRLRVTGDYSQSSGGSLMLQIAAQSGDAAPGAAQGTASQPPLGDGPPPSVAPAPQAEGAETADATLANRLFIPLAAQQIPGQAVLGEQLEVGGLAQLDGILRLVPVHLDAPASVTYPLVTAAVLQGVFAHVDGWAAGGPVYTASQAGYRTSGGTRLWATADQDVLAPSVLARAGYGRLARSIVRAVLSVRATDAQGRPLGGHPLQVSVMANPASGGHDHGEPPARPHGWVSSAAPSVDDPPDNGPPGSTSQVQIANLVTAADGLATLHYTAPEFAGIEAVRVKSLQDPAASVDLTFRVRALDNGTAFAELLGQADHDLVGSTPAHLHNHFGPSDLVWALQALARNYADQTGQRLPINDMGLGWGGFFDIGPRPKNPGWQLWRAPHGYHRGDAVDIGIESKQGNAVFEGIVREQGWWRDDPALWRSEGNHYHLTLEGAGAVSITAALHARRWDDAAHTLLRVSLEFENRGGLPADLLLITGLSGDHGVTVRSPEVPLSLGPLNIRQSASLDVLVQVPAGVNSFKLTVAGRSLRENRVFPLQDVRITVTRP